MEKPNCPECDSDRVTENETWFVERTLTLKRKYYCCECMQYFGIKWSIKLSNEKPIKKEECFEW